MFSALDQKSRINKLNDGNRFDTFQIYIKIQKYTKRLEKTRKSILRLGHRFDTPQIYEQILQYPLCLKKYTKTWS